LGSKGHKNRWREKGKNGWGQKKKEGDLFTTKHRGGGTPFKSLRAKKKNPPRPLPLYFSWSVGPDSAKKTGGRKRGQRREKFTKAKGAAE